MRFMPFAVLLAFIAHPTSGGTLNETLNSSCLDCYCERNSLASRDYISTSCVCARIYMEDMRTKKVIERAVTSERIVFS